MIVDWDTVDVAYGPRLLIIKASATAARLLLQYLQTESEFHILESLERSWTSPSVTTLIVESRAEQQERTREIHRAVLERGEVQPPRSVASIRSEKNARELFIDLEHDEWLSNGQDLPPELQRSRKALLLYLLHHQGHPCARHDVKKVFNSYDVFGSGDALQCGIHDLRKTSPVLKARIKTHDRRYDISGYSLSAECDSLVILPPDADFRRIQKDPSALIALLWPLVDSRTV